MIFTAFLFGSRLASRRAEKEGIAGSIVMDLTVWILISSLIGARIAYVMFHTDEFRGRWLDVINPFQSDGTIGIAGLVVLGGVLLAIPTTIYFCRKRNLNPMQIVDILVPSLAFGLAIGRIGCFLNGCCYGNPTNLHWGMVFPTTCLAGSVYPNQHIHPIQLYEIIYNSILGVILLLRTPHKKFNGELFYIYLILYGVIRGLIEPLRYYRESMVPFHIGGTDITVSMIISFGMAITGIILLMRGFKKAGLKD